MEYNKINFSNYKNALQYIIDKTKKWSVWNKKDNWKILYFYEEQDREQIINNIKKIKEDFVNIEFIPIVTVHYVHIVFKIN